MFAFHLFKSANQFTNSCFLFVCFFSMKLINKDIRALIIFATTAASCQFNPGRSGRLSHFGLRQSRFLSPTDRESDSPPTAPLGIMTGGEKASSGSGIGINEKIAAGK